MTWLAARAAIVTKFNGLQARAAGYAPETLTMLARPPKGVQGPDAFPLGFVLSPKRRTIARGGNGLRFLTVESTLRLLLHADDIEEAEDRLEAWIELWISTIGDSITLEDGSGLALGQEIGPLQEFGTGPTGAPYGVDMDLQIKITDVETRSP